MMIKIITIMILVLLSLNSIVLAEDYIVVYNSTNFTKPVNLTYSKNVTAYNYTVELPTETEEEVTLNYSENGVTLLMRLPPEFMNGSLNNNFTSWNLSYLNINKTNTTNITNENKSFMQKLDENPPLKYGFIIFSIVIIIVIAYIIYLNYGDGSVETISFGGDFAPSGHI